MPALHIVPIATAELIPVTEPSATQAVQNSIALFSNQARSIADKNARRSNSRGHSIAIRANTTPDHGRGRPWSPPQKTTTSRHPHSSHGLNSPRIRTTLSHWAPLQKVTMSTDEVDNPVWLKIFLQETSTPSKSGHSLERSMSTLSQNPSRNRLSSICTTGLESHKTTMTTLNLCSDSRMRKTRLSASQITNITRIKRLTH